MSLWTQLRHLSHIDRKREAKSSVGKAAARGVQGVSTAWAVNASSVTYFSLPTFRNLAGMPPSVNHLGGLGCSDGLHRRLPGLGTFGAQKAGCADWIASKRRLCVSPTKRLSEKTFYSVRHRHWRRHRERFIEPYAFDVRACLPVGPRTF
jgi:hypothetical protein